MGMLSTETGSNHSSAVNPSVQGLGVFGGAVGNVQGISPLLLLI